MGMKRGDHECYNSTGYINGITAKTLCYLSLAQEAEDRGELEKSKEYVSKSHLVDIVTSGGMKKTL